MQKDNVIDVCCSYVSGLYLHFVSLLLRLSVFIVSPPTTKSSITFIHIVPAALHSKCLKLCGIPLKEKVFFSLIHYSLFVRFLIIFICASKVTHFAVLCPDGQLTHHGKAKYFSFRTSFERAVFCLSLDSAEWYLS